MTYQAREDQVLYADLDPTEGVLLHLESKRYFRLNATGQIIWKALAETTTYSGLVKKLCETFDVDENTAKADITPFIEDLKREQFIDET